MTIRAVVLADSVNAYTRVRITTLQLRYPRAGVHEQLLTYRKEMARNSRSSRAVPVKRLCKDVLRDDSIPVQFRVNQAGMQPGEALPAWKNFLARVSKRLIRRLAVWDALFSNYLGVHKQWANRSIESFMHMDTVITSTNWDHFLSQRLHGDAQDEICQLAKAVKVALDRSVPEITNTHLPYYTEDLDGLSLKKAALICAARCARVSYKPFKGSAKKGIEADLDLANRLLSARPKHGSPFEHVALAQNAVEKGTLFRSWQPWRDII